MSESINKPKVFQPTQSEKIVALQQGISLETTTEPVKKSPGLFQKLGKKMSDTLKNAIFSKQDSESLLETQDADAPKTIKIPENKTNLLSNIDRKSRMENIQNQERQFKAQKEAQMNQINDEIIELTQEYKRNLERFDRLKNIDNEIPANLQEAAEYFRNQMADIDVKKQELNDLLELVKKERPSNESQKDIFVETSDDLNSPESEKLTNEKEAIFSSIQELNLIIQSFSTKPRNERTHAESQHFLQAKKEKAEFAEKYNELFDNIQTKQEGLTNLAQTPKKERNGFFSKLNSISKKVTGWFGGLTQKFRKDSSKNTSDISSHQSVNEVEPTLVDQSFAFQQIEQKEGVKIDWDIVKKYGRYVAGTALGGAAIWLAAPAILGAAGSTAVLLGASGAGNLGTGLAASIVGSGGFGTFGSIGIGGLSLAKLGTGAFAVSTGISQLSAYGGFAASGLAWSGSIASAIAARSMFKKPKQKKPETPISDEQLLAPETLQENLSQVIANIMLQLPERLRTDEIQSLITMNIIDTYKILSDGNGKNEFSGKVIGDEEGQEEGIPAKFSHPSLAVGIIDRCEAETEIANRIKLSETITPVALQQLGTKLNISDLELYSFAPQVANIVFVNYSHLIKEGVTDKESGKPLSECVEIPKIMITKDTNGTELEYTQEAFIEGVVIDVLNEIESKKATSTEAEPSSLSLDIEENVETNQNVETEENNVDITIYVDTSVTKIKELLNSKSVEVQNTFYSNLQDFASSLQNYNMPNTVLIPLGVYLNTGHIGGKKVLNTEIKNAFNIMISDSMSEIKQTDYEIPNDLQNIPMEDKNLIANIVLGVVRNLNQNAKTVLEKAPIKNESQSQPIPKAPESIALPITDDNTIETKPELSQETIETYQNFIVKMYEEHSSFVDVKNDEDLVPVANYQLGVATINAMLNGSSNTLKVKEYIPVLERELASKGSTLKIDLERGFSNAETIELGTIMAELLKDNPKYQEFSKHIIDIYTEKSEANVEQIVTWSDIDKEEQEKIVNNYLLTIGSQYVTYINTDENIRNVNDFVDQNQTKAEFFKQEITKYLDKSFDQDNTIFADPNKLIASEKSPVMFRIAATVFGNEVINALENSNSGIESRFRGTQAQYNLIKSSVENKDQIAFIIGVSFLKEQVPNSALDANLAAKFPWQLSYSDSSEKQVDNNYTNTAEPTTVVNQVNQPEASVDRLLNPEDTQLLKTKISEKNIDMSSITENNYITLGNIISENYQNERFEEIIKTISKEFPSVANNRGLKFESNGGLRISDKILVGQILAKLTN